MNHKILHSILVGKTESAPVFGDELSTPGLLAPDDVVAPKGNSAQVFAYGLRTSPTESYGEPQWVFGNTPSGWWTSAGPPFINGGQWTSRLKENFYLVAPPIPDSFQETPYNMGKFAIPLEILSDIQPYSRPALKDAVRDTSERDKGAHQTAW